MQSVFMEKKPTQDNSGIVIKIKDEMPAIFFEAVIAFITQKKQKILPKNNNDLKIFIKTKLFVTK